MTALTLLFSMLSAAGESALVCDGSLWLNGEMMELQATNFLDEQSGNARFSTAHGFATGTLVRAPDFYSGTVTARDGAAFHVSLNRYTGDLLITNVATKKADYAGSCRRATPKF